MLFPDSKRLYLGDFLTFICLLFFFTLVKDHKESDQDWEERTTGKEEDSSDRKKGEIIGVEDGRRGVLGPDEVVGKEMIKNLDPMSDPREQV